MLTCITCYTDSRLFVICFLNVFEMEMNTFPLLADLFYFCVLQTSDNILIRKKFSYSNNIRLFSYVVCPFLYRRCDY